MYTREIVSPKTSEYNQSGLCQTRNDIQKKSYDFAIQIISESLSHVNYDEFDPHANGLSMIELADDKLPNIEIPQTLVKINIRYGDTISHDPYINLKLLKPFLNCSKKGDLVITRLENISRKTHWIKENFPKLINPARCEEIQSVLKSAGISIPPDSQSPYPFQVNEPLSKNHTNLCIGVGRQHSNSRKHDLLSSYTINSQNRGNPHIDDDIGMLAQRSYLDVDGTPHQFEKIYIEVLCEMTHFINPAFMTYLNKHLKPGGKVYLETKAYYLTQQPIPKTFYEEFIKFGESHLYGTADSKDFNERKDENIRLETDTLSISYIGEKKEMVDLRISFNGDLKEYFNRFGFGEPRVADEVFILQVKTVPVEWTKISEST